MSDWIGHILLKNCLLKHVTEGQKGREQEEEHVRSYWMSLREKRRHWT
jgi:hypothetical protein